MKASNPRIPSSSEADTVFSIFKGYGFRPAYKKRKLEHILRLTHSNFLSNGIEPFKVSLPFDEEAIAEDLTYYTDNGYHTMDNDIYRNKWFQDALLHLSSSVSSSSSSSHHQEHHRWLEIGPGASGTLSRMVLEAHADNTLTAIEANVDSANTVRDLLTCKYGEKRVRILNAYADRDTIPSDQIYDGLIAEILGHFASSEGYLFILNACKQRLQDITAFIPETFGTLFVPVDLSRLEVSGTTESTNESSLYDLAKVGPRILQFNRFPFNLTQLSNSHGIMESYSTREVVASEKSAGPYTFVSEVKIDRAGSLDGLAFYIYLENEGIGRCTSNQDLPNRCTNWLNVFLPIDSSNSSVSVVEGDSIVCETIVHTEVYAVKYDFVITVKNNRGKCRYSTQRSINYADLLGNEGTVKECMEQLSR